MGWKTMTFLPLFVILAFISIEQIASADRCKPYNCDVKINGPYWIYNCLIPTYPRPTMVDCQYLIYTDTCEGIYCDVNDNSLYVGSDCTIDDQPPGNVPQKLPTVCDSEENVSYIWQTVVLIGGDPECSPVCWGCEPWEWPTKSLAEAKCKDSQITE